MKIKVENLTVLHKNQKSLRVDVSARTFQERLAGIVRVNQCMKNNSGSACSTIVF